MHQFGDRRRIEAEALLSPVTPKWAPRPSYSASSLVTGAPREIFKLVLDKPHVRLRGVDNGQTYFVEIFTWRDAAIPDHAPTAIQSIWTEMNKLVEGGGIEIAEVTPY